MSPMRATIVFKSFLTMVNFLHSGAGRVVSLGNLKGSRDWPLIAQIRILDEFNSPTELAIDSNIFVADTYNHCIQKIDLQGNFITEWGEYQVVSIVKSFLNIFVGAEGNFNYPTRIAVGLGNTLYFSDAYNNRVQMFSGEGRFLTQWGGKGQGTG